MGEIPMVKHSVHTLVFRSLKRTHDMFLSEQGNLPDVNEESENLLRAVKARSQYGPLLHLAKSSKETANNMLQLTDGGISNVSNNSEGGKLVPAENKSSGIPRLIGEPSTSDDSSASLIQIGNDNMLVPKRAPTMPKPVWHPRWKNYRVISGHNGWVRCITFDPTNQFFATGAADRIIKIWDLASGTLKLSLTGHVSTVRGLAISDRQPYLFSCGEDKTVRCWDLEQNKVVRHYHGHMSAVYGLDLHPSIDLLVTCGRDATARVWDMRTRINVHILQGHSNTVAAVKCQDTDPQVITASHDSTIRLWDLVAGKTMATLTNHKKSVRALALHPKMNAFISGSPDNIKQWKLPEGMFLQNLSGHNAIINAIGLNEDGVVVSGADNGSLYFWDWTSGYNFDHYTPPVQPGSIDSESGVFALGFDRSGSRFATCNADKTIKFFKEVETDTEENFPVKWRPNILKKSKF